MRGKLGRIRERHILGHARPCLAEGEEVELWVRARRAPDGKHGFAYLASRGLVLCWTHGKDERHVVNWDEIESWGVKLDHAGGPVLAVAAAGETAAAQLPSPTNRKAEAVSAFLAAFATRARGACLTSCEGIDGFGQPRSPAVRRQSRSLTGHGKRVALTVAGLSLILVGVAFASPFVPGPGILTILAGLAILAGEYDWAKDAHHWVRTKAQRFLDRVRRRIRRKARRSDDRA
jgi:uncharacterized protein (TIGR02611 family)